MHAGWGTVKNWWHWLRAWFWVIYYGYPAGKMTVVGVTGTDGKTTTTTLIYEILRAAGFKVAVLTTVGAKIGAEEVETGLHATNPDPAVIQSLLKRMVGAGMTHAVLEVTSHGLDQNRVVGCNFAIGVLTNLTHEHLDYHGTMKKYGEAKLKLFGGVKYAVLNVDDESFEFFKSEISQVNPEGKILVYGRSKLKGVSERLAGEYNKSNIGAAEAVVKILGVGRAAVARVVRDFGGVPGRREEVREGQDYRVVVDFAHTPNALEQVLKALKVEAAKQAKLIVVFGATGERDREKRPIMGKVAGELADVVVITSDDTRKESQDEIARQIMSGIRDQGPGIRVIKENDRRRAIELALGMARTGDIVLLAGKGHEKSLLLGTTEYPWSDVEVAREVLRRL